MPIDDSDSRTKEGWSRALPEHVPGPTWWPSATALAVTAIFFGLLTTPAISGVGLLLLFVSAAAWILEMRND